MNLESLTNNLINWGLEHGIKILVILVLTWLVLKLTKKAISRIVSPFIRKTYGIRDHIALEKREQTLTGIFYSATKVIILVIAGLLILSELDFNIGPLLAGAGIAGLALGFGGQYLIRDVIAGLFIILEDQYRKGDVVKIGGVAGLVEEITLRKTVLRDLDGIEHHIPNGEISVTSNLTKLWSRIHLNIGVSYETDLDKAMTVLNKVGQELAEDPDWKEHITQAPQAIGVDDFAESAIIIKVLGETKPMKQWDAMRELRKRIKIAFDREGIEIPFPHRVIIQKRLK